MERRGAKDDAVGLFQPMVDALAVDRDGSLWIGSRGGLSRLAYGQLSHYRAKDDRFGALCVFRIQ
jgi:ligand-binding sensor domain-containing protein